MKKQLLILALALISFNFSYGQTCIGSNTTGTHNDCFLNTSRQANINLANIDSVIAGKWYGDAIGITYGGTGANNASTALANLLPSQSGNAWKALITDGSSASWQSVNAMVDSSIYATRYYTSQTYQPIGSYLTGNQTITLSGDVTGSGATAITATLANSGVSSGKYDWVTVNTKGIVTAGGNMSVPTAIASGGRNFNQAYQISSTVQSTISVSAQISCALSLSGGQAGNIKLEISANGSTGWIFMGQITASNTGTLTIGLNTTQISGGQLIADLPAGYYWRLTTSNTTGTPTYTFNGGNEITY